MSRKLALIIGNSEYDDQTLARLKAPEADVAVLAELLRDPAIGAFAEVETLVNRPFSEIHPAIAAFFADKRPDDLLLLYFSGHGVLDPQGRLFLGLKNTRRTLLSGTAIASGFIKEQMDDSRSRRQVLILDCCHSGAFARGAKGATGAQAITDSTFEGHGRVVLTATDITQYAWEGEQVIGETANSLFTHFLIEGLKTGAADADHDGHITPDELYDFVFDKIANTGAKQKPRKIVYDQQGEIVIARSIRALNPGLTELPPELRQLIESPVASAREGAVRELTNLLNGSVSGLRKGARVALQTLSADDSNRVANAAKQALASSAMVRDVKESIDTGVTQLPLSASALHLPSSATLARGQLPEDQLPKAEARRWLTLVPITVAWLIGHIGGLVTLRLQITPLVILATIGGAISIVLVVALGLSVSGPALALPQSKVVRLSAYFLLAGLLGGFVGLSLWVVGCAFPINSLTRQAIGCDEATLVWKLLTGASALVALAGACALTLVELGLSRVSQALVRKR